jgi:hypothetical protein
MTQGTTHSEQTDVEVSNRAVFARSPALERILIHCLGIFSGILLPLADFRALKLAFSMEAVACPPSVQAVLFTVRQSRVSTYRFCLMFHNPCIL